jgi:hypothetical protein
MLRARVLAVVLSMLWFSVMPAGAAEQHVLDPQAVAQRLHDANAERQDDLVTIESVLDTPQAIDTMRGLGANPSEVRAGVATLSASELQDLAARARTLSVDPQAGLSSDVNTLLIVFLIVAIVVLVLAAVD